MSKAKRNALAVLFTAVALFMFAALLCLGFPMEAKAESGEAAYGASVNTFTAEMPEGYLANNVSDAAAADGSSAEETVVANITRGGQTLEFFTVQGAIDAAQDGETIKIPSCSAITEEITVASGKNIKINLLSEVTLGGTFVNNGTVAIDISAGASSRYKPSVFDATITNNAGAELSIDINYAASGPRYAELKGTVSNSGTLTLTGTGNCNAQITNATDGVLTVKSNLNVYGAITNSGTFTIANGTYNGNIVNNGGTIAIQGGNFTQEQKEAFGDYLAEGYRWTLSSTAGNFSAIAEESVVYTLTRDGAEYGFASLSAALTAADEGETIVLEKPYSIKTPNSTQKLNKSVTVDLNGKKISTQSRFEATTAGTDITVKNGSIVYTGNGSNATYVGFRVSGGASLTLDGVSVDWSSIDSGRAAEVGVSNTSAAGTLILKNGSVLKGGEVGVFLAGTKDADTENKTALYAEDSIIESVATASAGVMTNGSTYNTVIELVNTDVSGTLAIYQPSKNSILTIDGGTMRGNTGIEIRNGTLTVKGGAEIVATGEYKVSETPSSGGSTVSGAALAVTKYENDGTLTVNIEGGTFRAESENGVAFCERNPEAADGTHSPGNVPSVSITGGIFEGGVSAVNVQKFIEGGTFTAEGDISAYLADGLTTNEDGTVVPDAQPNAVAKVTQADGSVQYYERLADAFLAAKDGATVDILKDVKQTAESDLAVGYYNGEGGVWMYVQDKSLIINGNGHTLTCTTAAWAMYILNNDKTGQIETLTINDLTIDVTTPKVQDNDAKVTSCAGIVLWHGETNLTLNNVTVNTEACGVKNATALSVAGNGKNTTIDIQGGAFKAAQDTGYAFMANNPVRFTAEDTEFSGWAAIYLRCGKVTSGSAALGTSGSVVTLKNTKLYGYGQYQGEISKFGVIVLNDGGITVNVIGGSVNLAPAEGAMMQSVVYYSTFSGANPSTSKVTFEDTDVTLTGSNTAFVWGTFNQNAGGDVTVAGGTFNFAVTENYLAEGYAPLLQADGTYAVVDREDAVAAGQAVAALSTTDIYGREVQALYSTLQAAVNAAKEGDTVTLLANVTESIEIAQGQDIVLDLNGKTLTNAAGSHTVTNYGTLTIVGEGTVTNTAGGKAAVFNEGTATINGGTFTADAVAIAAAAYDGQSSSTTINGGTFTAGSHGSEAALYFFDYDGNSSVNVTITGGTFNGTYAIRTYQDSTADDTMSIQGGTFEGDIAMGDMTGFISGGQFRQQPAAEYMDPDYIAEYRDGFYVPVESSALYIAQNEARADIRMYAASLGIAWSDVVAAADPENASPYQAEAALVMNAYNAIAAAASEKQVADAKLEAMGELDALYDAIEYAEQQAEAELAKIKQNYITELQNLAKGSETQEEVVVPTATYLAINNAATAEEAELYYENAVKEINDIRAYRTAIGGQADQLTELAETLEALNTSLFGTEGAGGAFNGLLGDIELAIKNAQNAIVNGAAGEEGSTSASLAGIQKYLEKTIKTALDGIADTLKGTTADLTAIKSSIEGLDVSGQLAEDFQAVLDKIAAAQGAITGATEEGAGVSIADAVEQINEVNKATAEAVAGLRVALVGTDGNGGKLGGLTTAVGALQGLLEDQDCGLEAIATKIDAAKDAILGTAGGDGGSATGLQAVLEAVNGVNDVTDKVLAAVQGLAAPENGVVAQIKGELESKLEAIEGLTGKLATSNAVADVKEDIKGAQAEIDKIVAAIGSLGTAEGNDLAAKIEQVVGSLAAVQGTVGSIAESVNASTTVEAVKGDAMTDIAAWLNEYLDDILGTAGEAGSGVAAVRAFTAETAAGDIYAKLAQAFSEDNAKLVLKYYNDALAAIDAATTVSEVTTAVSTFKAQVASVEAAAQNVTDVDLTGVYVLLAILVVAVAVVIVVMILKRRQQPAAQEVAVQEAAPVQAQAAPEPVTHEVAVTDDDKEQVVIAANVRSFSEAYVDLSQELRELFNKVRAYALGKENAVEVRQSTGVCVKRNGKQIVKLTVRRNAPVALFFLENEMLKDFRRESGSQSKLKVHATELILREEADLAAAYKMVDLSLEQIDKDIAAKKERAKELRRLRRQQKAEQSKKDGAES